MRAARAAAMAVRLLLLASCFASVAAAPAPAARELTCRAACASPPAAWSRTAPPQDLVARGRKGVVVTAEPLATAVGLEVLQNGGNAVDAAVAVALALAVTHPQAGNLGGGGFLLLRLADGTATSIDFRECAPAAATRDLYLDAHGAFDAARAQQGVTAAGVPGSPAGLCYALERYGSKPLAELAAPAIRLAREGFVVDQFLAEDLHDERESLLRHASSRAVFCRDGELLQQGERLRQPDLAATLERLAANGRDGFYGGRTAELLLAQMAKDGGYCSAADLAAYQPVERPVLRGRYRSVEVLTMAPPSSGGVALLEMLGMLAHHDLAALGFGGSDSDHLLIEVMRRAYADRARWLGDPDHYPVPVEGLLAKDYLDGLAASIDAERVTPVAPGRPKGGKESDDTTHFSIVDAAGNAVACTTTINSTFGAGVVVEGAGFLLNNEMDDFAAKPGEPNQFGLIGGEANAIAPHKRMLSSMTPTIVLRDGRLSLVLGAPGGGRIITAVLQVLLNVVDHRMPLERAVAAPRIHHQWAPDEVQWEPLALPPDVRRALAQKGHAFAPRPRGIARVFAVQVLADGERIGVADPRSGGSAAAY